jgi:hypothetical protein
MKTLTKLSFIAATVAALGSSAAFADDSQLRNRLTSQEAQDSPRASNSPTVALYSTRNGVSGSASQDERPEVRFQLQSNSHGQAVGSYASIH